MKKMKKSMLRWSFVLVLVLTASLGFANEMEPWRVDWESVPAISWDLFQGTPPMDAAHRTEAAAIHMTIRWHASYSVSSSNGSHWSGKIASITVTNTMEPALSWVVPGKNYPTVLEHEQLHFDLNEAYRRKLECLLLATQACSGSTQQGAVDLLNSTLHQTANAVLQKLSEMQALYDAQTSHGNNAGEQARWRDLIVGWLAAPTTAP